MRTLQEMTLQEKLGQRLAAGFQGLEPPEEFLRLIKEYKVGNETYIDSNGINANNKTISNVAPGRVDATSTDAVNGSQLYQVKQDIPGRAQVKSCHKKQFDIAPAKTFLPCELVKDQRYEKHPPAEDQSKEETSKDSLDRVREKQGGR